MFRHLIGIQSTVQTLNRIPGMLGPKLGVTRISAPPSSPGTPGS